MTSSQATCYYPDKSRATGFEPCNSTLAGPSGAGSACCAVGEVCTTGGFCLNDLYYPYRGACTDRSWNSVNCASECLGGEWFLFFFSFGSVFVYDRVLLGEGAE